MSVTELTPLTKAQSEAVDYMREHGGKLTRYPGGFWAKADWQRWKDPHFGTSTIEGLVKRGWASYTTWQAGRNGRFPVEVTLWVGA